MRIFGRGKASLFSLIKPIDYIMAVFFLANSLWIFLIPKLNGLSINLAIQDVGILLIIILYFPLAILIRMGAVRFKTIIDVFYWTTFILACWYIIMWCLEVKCPGSYQKYLEIIRSTKIFKVGEVFEGWSIVRIVLGNSVLLAPGLIISIYRSKKFALLNYLTVFIFTFAILCTFLKSLWYGLAFSIGFLLICFLINIIKHKQNYNLIKALIVICCTIVILNITVFQGSILFRISNSFSNKLTGNSVIIPDETTEDETGLANKYKIAKDSVDSNTEKLIQIQKLTNQWLKKPVFGFGYGSYIPDYLRSQRAIYSYEMTAFALLMKIGIIGIAVWITLAVSAGVNLYINTKNNRKTFMVWLAIVLGFLISIQTNPYLFTANSISFILYIVLYTISMEKPVLLGGNYERNYTSGGLGNPALSPDHGDVKTTSPGV